MFNVGDVVVCVDAGPCKCCGDPLVLEKKRVYRVGAILRRRDGDLSLVLVGISGITPRHPRGRGFWSERFRKVTPADEGFKALIRRCIPVPV